MSSADPSCSKNRITVFTGQVTVKRSQRIPFDGFGKISAQASDPYTFTFVLYKIHMAISSFSYIYHPLDSSLSSG